MARVLPSDKRPKQIYDGREATEYVRFSAITFRNSLRSLGPNLPLAVRPFSATRTSCTVTTAEPAGRFAAVGQSHMKTMRR